MICLCLGKGDIDQMITLYADNFSDGWNKNQLQSSFETGRFIALGVKESGELEYNENYSSSASNGVMSDNGGVIYIGTDFF